MNILIIDDDFHMRELYKIILEKEHTLFLSESAIAALPILANERIDLVILDLHRPYLNGLELAEFMSSISTLKNLDIIVISAIAEVYKERLMLLPNVTLIVDKINNFDVLKKIINDHISSMK